MAFPLRLTLFAAHAVWLKGLYLQILIALVQQIQTLHVWEHVGTYMIVS